MQFIHDEKKYDRFKSIEHKINIRLEMNNMTKICAAEKFE